MKGNKQIENFELTAIKDKKGFDDLYIKRLTPGKEKDLGKASMGKFYNSIGNLGENGKDPERYVSVIQRINGYTCGLRLGERYYQINIPKELPTEIVFTEKDEHVKDFRGKGVRI